jgi:hypothetical protein
MITFLVHSPTAPVPEALRGHASLEAAQSAAAALAQLNPGHAFHPYQQLDGYQLDCTLELVPA